MIYDVSEVNRIMETILEINGKTKIIVHLAYPSTHLRTPSFFNPLMDMHRRNAVLVPWQVSPENLSQVWEALRVSESVAGVIVTIRTNRCRASLRQAGGCSQVSEGGECGKKNARPAVHRPHV